MNLDRSFPAHPLPKPDPAVLSLAALVREKFRALAIEVNSLLPDSREKALTMTHLEDASTYAVKAVYADNVGADEQSPA